MHLSLSFLGSFQATVNSDLIPDSRSKKIEALLIYLAMESRTAHRRETLVGLFFPDLPDETARTNLRQTLTRLRKAIKDKEADPPFLLISRETTQFNQSSRTTFDIRQFDALLQGCERHIRQLSSRCADCIARLESAITLYRGPFLDGFFLEDSVAFDEWMLVYRERYHQLAVSALQAVSDYYERRGTYETAQKYVERLLEIEPWDEGAQRQYLRVLAYQGKRNIALAKFEQFSQRLYDELGVEPMQETVALRQQIAGMSEKRPFSLPQREHQLVGRLNSQELIFEQLVNPETRLITLVGHGGIGKTRLSLEVGWRTVERHLGSFIHGTFFVPLADIEGQGATEETYNALITAVSQTIGYTFEAARSPEEQLFAYLKDKSLLLILDNLEHVLETSREFIVKLLKQTAQVKVLVTSRERLNLMVEWVHTIQGLPYPNTEVDLERIEAFGAVQLFVVRAQQANGRFHLSETNQNTGDAMAKETVAQICQKLEGFPLALELAAPLVQLMNGKELLQEISNNYNALASKMHNIPARHQSIRAVFESSWQLLSETEKTVAMNLSVFRGGFERTAAKEVVDATIQTLSTLLDKSLLNRMSASGETTRYQMQELLRQFCELKRLDIEHADGHSLHSKQENPVDAVAQAHGRYFLTMISDLYADLIGSNQIEALNTVNKEYENIKRAWRLGLNLGWIAKLRAATETLALFFYMRSWLVEGSDFFNKTVEVLKLSGEIEGETAVFISALQARQGWFNFLQGNQKKGIQRLEESLTMLQANEEHAESVFPLSYLAAANQITGNLERAKSLATEGLSLSEQFNNRYYVAISNNILSQIAYQQGEYQLARSYVQKSLEIERQLDNRWSMGFSLANLGRSAYATQSYEQALVHYEESLAIRETLNDIRGQALCLNYLGDIRQAQQRFEEAQKLYEQALAKFQKISSPSGVASTLIRLGHVSTLVDNKANAKTQFLSAIKHAKRSDSLPNLLAALLGIAVVQAENQTIDAILVAKLVLSHPAATPDSKQRAERLLTTISSTQDVADRPLSIEEAINIFSV